VPVKVIVGWFAAGVIFPPPGPPVMLHKPVYGEGGVFPVTTVEVEQTAISLPAFGAVVGVP
jgi:hypothetical protein